MGLTDKLVAERRARLAAERKLELKSRELFEANRKLSQHALELSGQIVEQREQVAQVLCRLDERVLREIWDQLDEDQLQFQDFVFARKCGDRNQLYGEATERFRTPDS